MASEKVEFGSELIGGHTLRENRDGACTNTNVLSRRPPRQVLLQAVMRKTECGPGSGRPAYAPSRDGAWEKLQTFEPSQLGLDGLQSQYDAFEFFDAGAVRNRGGAAV